MKTIICFLLLMNSSCIYAIFRYSDPEVLISSGQLSIDVPSWLDIQINEDIVIVILPSGQMLTFERVLGKPKVNAHKAADLNKALLYFPSTDFVQGRFVEFLSQSTNIICGCKDPYCTSGVTFTLIYKTYISNFFLSSDSSYSLTLIFQDGNFAFTVVDDQNPENFFKVRYKTCSS